jgi:PAS domain-containing protein
MAWLSPVIRFVAAPLMPVMIALTSSLASAAHRNPTADDCITAAFALSVGLIGLFCVFSAVCSRACLQSFKAKARMEIASLRSMLLFREALLGESGEGVVVLRSDSREREFYGEGKALYQALVESDHADQAIRAIEALAEHGTAFVLPACAGGLELRGCPVGGRAVIYLRKARAAIEPDRRGACEICRDVLERIPVAVAVFDGDQRLVNYNDACALLWGFPRFWLEKRPSYEEILEGLRDKRRLPEQRNFAEWKQAQIQFLAAKDSSSEEFWHIPNGKSVRVVIKPHGLGGKFMLMEDISERLHLKSSLNLLTRVHRATLDILDEGVAVFGTDGRLVVHNTAFADMWHLREGDLAGQPHFTEIAGLCSERIGRDGIWGIVSCGINSASPASLGDWGKTKRADGRVISPALVRLPDGATAVTFTDLTDVDRFEAEAQAIA